MKKSFVTLCGVVCVGLAGLSLWASGRSESAFRAWVGRLAQQPEVRLLKSDYQRGWLHSSGSFTLEVRGALGELFGKGLAAAGRPDVRGRIGLRSWHAVDHGAGPLWRWLRSGNGGVPIVAVVSSRFELDKESQSELAVVLGRVPGLTAETRVRADGLAESHFSVPSRDLEPRIGRKRPLLSARGRWRGFAGRADFALDASTLVARFESDGAELRSDSWRFSMADVSGRVEAARDPTGFWRVSGSQRVGRMAWTAGESGTPLRLEGWTLQQTTRESEGALQIELEARLETLAAGRTLWGPARAALALRDLDPQRLAALRGSVAEANEASGTRQEPWQPRGPVRAGARRTPVLELEVFEFVTPGGTLQASGQLRVDPSRRVQPPTGLLSGAIDASLELAGPARLLDAFVETRGAGAGLEERGLLLREGDRVRTRLELRGGAVVVNGVPLERLSGTVSEPAALADASLGPSLP